MYANDEDDDEELLAVEGHDGNQYVVLEVIQLPEGGGHHVMVGGEQLPLDGSVLPSSPLVVGQQDPAINSAAVLGYHHHHHHHHNHHHHHHKTGTDGGTLLQPDDIKKETKKEMDTCFGFDDDGETGQIHLQFGE